MNDPRRLTLAQWNDRRRELLAAGMEEPEYGGPLQRHLEDGDYRLESLRFDDSPAALRLWNFLLTEEDRLREARARGTTIVGAMKDLGTVPVMACSLPDMLAFYPDGAWWIPCVMELSAGLLAIADELGIDESFCPVRALLGAFVTGAHFPQPDLLICSTGAVCDDLSVIAQRVNSLGHPVLWWEMPCRQREGDDDLLLPGGDRAPRRLVDFTMGELARLRDALSTLAGRRLTDSMLQAGIGEANRIRRLLRRIRELAYGAPRSPMPALELLIAEMLALHFCSDREECGVVLEHLLAEITSRVARGGGCLPPGAARVYWVNPVADLQVMNLLEECGGRICGTEYLFAHALDEIPPDLPPLEALARTALADPMVGPVADRARRICEEAVHFRAEGVVISRIPGASHCAFEGEVIAEEVERRLGLPVLEIEVPPLSDALQPGLRTRLEALIEVILSRRERGRR